MKTVSTTIGTGDSVYTGAKPINTTDETGVGTKAGTKPTEEPLVEEHACRVTKPKYGWVPRQMSILTELLVLLI